MASTDYGIGGAMASLSERVDAMEITLMELAAGLKELRAGQLRAAQMVEYAARTERDLIKATAAQAKIDLQLEADRVSKEFAKQNEQLLSLATSLLTFRTEVSRWGALAALLGAVALFIAVRALGFH